MISEQDLCSLHQVSVQDLQKRSPGKISVQDLYKSSIGKISAQDLYKRSLGKISARGLLARSLYKLPIRGLLARCLCEISRFVRAWCEPAHSKCTWACHKSHAILKLRKNTAPQDRDTCLCEPAQSKMHRDI